MKRMGPARKVPRHEFSVSANLHPARGESTVVTVRDISTMGCRVEHVKIPKIGKHCELYFEWRGTMVGVEARVVWDDAEGRAGLKYQKVDEHAQKCLQELCASLHLRRAMGRRAGDSQASGAAPHGATFQWAHHPMFPPLAAPTPARGTGSESSRRKLPRYISELRGDLLNSATGKTAEVFLVDLSVSGARLEGAGLPDAGQICQLRTERDGGRILLPGKVAWKTSKQAGMKFTPLDDETARQLREICASLLLAPPGPRV
jgi:hypothetical protein